MLPRLAKRWSWEAGAVPLFTSVRASVRVAWKPNHCFTGVDPVNPACTTTMWLVGHPGSRHRRRDSSSLLRWRSAWSVWARDGEGARRRTGTGSAAAPRQRARRVSPLGSACVVDVAAARAVRGAVHGVLSADLDLIDAAGRQPCGRDLHRLADRRSRRAHRHFRSRHGSARCRARQSGDTHEQSCDQHTGPTAASPTTPTVPAARNRLMAPSFDHGQNPTVTLPRDLPFVAGGCPPEPRLWPC